MRLELNLPALERLIGGDSEMELALRKQIAEVFADKYLKKMTAEIIAEELQKRLRGEWEAMLKAEVNAKLNEYVQQLKEEAKNPYTTTRAGWTFKEPVEQAAQKALDEALANMIKWQKHDMGKLIDIAVKKEMDCQIEKKVAEGIRLRLEAAAKGVGVPS